MGRCKKLNLKPEKIRSYGSLFSLFACFVKFLLDRSVLENLLEHSLAATEPQLLFIDTVNTVH